MHAYSEYYDYLYDVIWCITGVGSFSPWARKKNIVKRVESRFYGSIRLNRWDVEELTAWLLESRDSWWGESNVEARALKLPGPFFPADLAGMTERLEERDSARPSFPAPVEGLEVRRKRMRQSSSK